MLQRELSYIIQPRSVTPALGGQVLRCVAVGAHVFVYYRYTRWAPGGTRRRQEAQGGATGGARRGQEDARRRQKAPGDARDEVGRGRERQEKLPGGSPGGPGCPERVRQQNNEVTDDTQGAKNSFLLKTSLPKRQLFANTAPAHRSSEQDS